MERKIQISIGLLIVLWGIFVFTTPNIGAGWVAFYYSAIAGVSVGYGLYLCTEKSLASLLLAMGLWVGIIYPMLVGHTMTTVFLQDIREMVRNQKGANK